MNEKEALILLNELVNYAAKKPIILNKDNDLRRDKILDSLSMLIFFMELENRTGIVMPDTDVLVSEGWYNVEYLCAQIVTRS